MSWRQTEASRSRRMRRCWALCFKILSQARCGRQTCRIIFDCARLCLQLTLRTTFVAQVTQKYLEHLVSQRQFEKTAAACAKLLKVMPSFSMHPAVKRGISISQDCFYIASVLKSICCKELARVQVPQRAYRSHWRRTMLRGGSGGFTCSRSCGSCRRWRRSSPRRSPGCARRRTRWCCTPSCCRLPTIRGCWMPCRDGRPTCTRCPASRSPWSRGPALPSCSLSCMAPHGTTAFVPIAASPCLSLPGCTWPLTLCPRRTYCEEECLLQLSLCHAAHAGPGAQAATAKRCCRRPRICTSCRGASTLRWPSCCACSSLTPLNSSPSTACCRCCGRRMLLRWSG